MYLNKVKRFTNADDNRAKEVVIMEHQRPSFHRILMHSMTGLT